MPQLVLALNAVLVFWLFRKDMRLRKLPSPGLWIPAVWLTIVASRGVSLWLAALGIHVGGSDDLEGSPLDMAFFLTLMVAALVVLNRKGFDWANFIRNNKALIAIFLYLALSAFWSVIGFASFKRAIKDFGHVLIALVILSELDPLLAMRIVYVRVAYLLFPLSVVLIKYFPTIGRVPSRSHDNIFSGVTMHKNSLGCTVFVLGLFLILDLMELKQRREGEQKIDEWIRYGMLAIGIWLLLTCNSLTSMICLSLAWVLLFATGRLLRMKDPKRMLFRWLGIIACLAAFNYCFGISSKISEAFGRGENLSGRTYIWEMVEKAQTNPIMGCGFYSFWSTEGAQEISDIFKGTLASAHNGLLEMYLDGGGIGLALLILLLLVWGRRSVQKMLEGTLFGRVKLIFLLLAVIDNFSETGYFRFTPLWFTLLVLMIDCPPSRQTISATNATASGSTLHAA